VRLALPRAGERPGEQLGGPTAEDGEATQLGRHRRQRTSMHAALLGAGAVVLLPGKTTR
jgi:hypothetical protein